MTRIVVKREGVLADFVGQNTLQHPNEYRHCEPTQRRRSNLYELIVIMLRKSVISMEVRLRNLTLPKIKKALQNLISTGSFQFFNSNSEL